MPSHRFLFYAPQLDRSSGEISVDGEEHHHICNVLRLSEGDRIHVTNGCGLIVSAVLKAVARNCSVAEVIDIAHEERERPAVVLALALLRKDRFAQAVEQCTELGMAQCLPFVCPGSRVDRFGEGALRRLQRVAIAAMKQSFRAYLPTICAPVEFGELEARVRSTQNVFLGGQGSPAMPFAVRGEVLVIVGPESGLGQEEVATLSAAGASRVSVSPHRLRSETAAGALVAAAVRAIDSAASTI